VSPLFSLAYFLSKEVIVLTWLTLSNGLHVADIIGPHEIKILKLSWSFSRFQQLKS
jgi:hypothetical protein